MHFILYSLVGQRKVETGIIHLKNLVKHEVVKTGGVMTSNTGKSSSHGIELLDL